MERKMENTYTPVGKTTISPEVLVSIALLATMSVDGVSRLTAGPREVNSLFKKGLSEGINITVEDNIVYADIYVVLKKDVNVRAVSKNIQNQVSRSISELVGMEIGSVNIHIEDIDFSD
jgi:uncharacterized alkaline shock family protein YloU